MKRIIAAILALVLVLGLTVSMTACAKKEEEKESTKESTEEKAPTEEKTPTEEKAPTEEKNPTKEKAPTEEKAPTVPTKAPETTAEPVEGLVFDQLTEFKPGHPKEKLDPEDVYDNLTYTPQMFYGEYRILGGEEGIADYAEEMSLVEYQDYNYNKEKIMETITAVPYRFEAGPHSYSHVLNQVKGRNFMRAYFRTETGDMAVLSCAYTVEGDTLNLNPVAFYENDLQGHIRYNLSETMLSYQFRFEGRKLTLTDGKNTVELYSGLDIYTDDVYLSADGYCSYKSPKLHNIDAVYVTWYEEEDSAKSARRMTVQEEDYHNSRYVYAVMQDNGLINITLDVGEKVVTEQFVYFYCWNDGIILTDGETVYYYQENFGDRYSNQLGDNLDFEDVGKLENMDQEKLEQIVETKTDLLTDLGKAFQDAGIAVTIDAESGEITMDAAVLFPVGEYAVSEEGKALLKSFIGVYTGVVFNEKYDGFLSKIMVEGHTDSTGDYDKNQTLSQNRADSVKTLCLEYGGDYADKLADMLQAEGYSSDKLIIDASGKEDQAASRRVCFRFVINLNG